MKRNDAYDRLCGQARELHAFRGALSLLWWDEETCLPPQGLASRSRQVEVISGYLHRRFATAETGDWLAACAAEPLPEGSVEAANVRGWAREHARAVKLPAGHVAEEAATSSRARAVWAEARRRNDFAMFLPWLEKQVELRRKRADFLGFEAHPYDALIDQFEPGMTTVRARALLDGLRPRLAEIAAAAVARARSVPANLLAGDYPVEAQAAFNREVAAALGFDFTAGRIDTATHPFCSRISPGDVRMTTRYKPDDFTDSLFGVLHEAGHGLYEQGLPGGDQDGLPVGHSVSLGVHESQSRLWENHVGRSLPFWERWLPRAADHFPHLASLEPEQMVAALTRSRRGFIRVGADEATYDLHIVLRFGLEVDLIEGKVQPCDVPGEWNERFRELFGLSVPDDTRGCLQDIHWSMGSIGYFATYTMGNLLAAQLLAAARAGDPGLAGAFDRGDFWPLLAWMRTHVHAAGSRFLPDDLVRRASGRDLGSGDFLAHLRRRYLGAG
jgi:carboxypeptidase Taq